MWSTGVVLCSYLLSLTFQSTVSSNPLLFSHPLIFPSLAFSNPLPFLIPLLFFIPSVFAVSCAQFLSTSLQWWQIPLHIKQVNPTKHNMYILHSISFPQTTSTSKPLLISNPPYSPIAFLNQIRKWDSNSCLSSLSCWVSQLLLQGKWNSVP